MEGHYQTIGLIILLTVMAVTCHEAVNAECYYCPSVKCIDNRDCLDGCVCVGSTGRIGSCMSLAGEYK